MLNTSKIHLFHNLSLGYNFLLRFTHFLILHCMIKQILLRFLYTKKNQNDIRLLQLFAMIHQCITFLKAVREEFQEFYVKYFLYDFFPIFQICYRTLLNYMFICHGFKNMFHFNHIFFAFFSIKLLFFHNHQSILYDFFLQLLRQIQIPVVSDSFHQQY